MCGIAGAINYQKYNLDDIKESLYHRGPDEQTIYYDGNIALLHTRLAIQDISHGQQPIHYSLNTSSNDYSIIFNGEIYNHMELREQYLKEFDFKTLSDTETLLYLYVKYNNEMYHYLDGMFAFAIFDKRKQKLILSRDRAGKKPLFIYKDQDSLCFASELTAIKKAKSNLRINEQAISAYLRCGFFYKNFTPYEAVDEIEAGFTYEIDIFSLDIKKFQYFEIKNFYEMPKIDNLDSALVQLDKNLHKSVKDRLLSSDLEVGAFLSGGIDSSLVVAIASQYVNKLKTYTIKFDGAYDESHLAKLTARKYQTEHTELSISMNLKKDIEKILLNYGQPFMDSSAIPSYYVSQEAKKHVTVILNGDGADELFGGYRRYVPAANNLISLAQKFSFLLKVLPKAHNKKSLYNYFYRLLAMSNKKGLDFYLSSTYDIYEDVYSFKENSITKFMDDFCNNIQLDALSKMLYSDFNLLLFSDLLVKMDIATMSNSLEGRSPFLSKHMLEFAPQLSNKLKIKGTNTKYILRELSKKYLPLELITQPKRGFEVPLKSWIKNDLKENVFEALNNNSYASDFIEQSFITDILENKINVSEEKRAKILWNLYCLEIWKKNQ
jgi:asparagine synthase (glutamine-hydrolysing)